MGEPDGIDWMALICWLIAAAFIAAILFTAVGG